MADGKALAMVGVLLLSIYFFVFYLFVSTSIEMAYEYDLTISDINVNDPGFFNDLYNTNESGRCGGSFPLSSVFCSKTLYTDELTCVSVPGCTWDAVNDDCEGFVDTNQWNPSGALNQNCNGDINETVCLLIGCSWIESDVSTGQITNIDASKPYDWAKVWRTVSYMATFSADIGLGQFTYGFAIAFFVFWIPLLFLILCIYLLTPLIH